MNTLFDDQRYQQRRELGKFALEIGIKYNPDKEVVFQVTEVLKTMMYYFKLYTKKELVYYFPIILESLEFPDATWPSHQWTMMTMKYIRRMKQYSKYVNSERLN